MINQWILAIRHIVDLQRTMRLTLSVHWICCCREFLSIPHREELLSATSLLTDYRRLFCHQPHVGEVAWPACCWLVHSLQGANPRYRSMIYPLCCYDMIRYLYAGAEIPYGPKRSNVRLILDLKWTNLQLSYTDKPFKLNINVDLWQKPFTSKPFTVYNRTLIIIYYTGWAS